eukprot:COSAG01_NODE_7_length_54400_cov_1218.054935_14_plen_334_part_00
MKIARIRRSDLPNPISRLYKQKISKGKGKVNEKEQIAASQGNDSPVSLVDLQLEGDADASQDLWTKEFPDVPDSHQPDQEFLSLIKQAEEPLAYYAVLPRMTGMRPLSAKQSLQHLTLPEAVLLLSLLKQEVPVGYSRFTLRPLQHKQDQVLRCRLQLQPLHDEGQTWHLAFHAQRLKASIIQDAKRVGRFDYEIHGGRLEKIYGAYKGLSVVLDPVWGKKSLRYERLQLGDFQSDLIKHKTSQKLGQFRQHQGLGWQLKVLSLASGRVDQRSFMTRKVWRLGPYHVQTRLLFVKGLLFPLVLHAAVYREAMQQKVACDVAAGQFLTINFLES